MNFRRCVLAQGRESSGSFPRPPVVSVEQQTSVLCELQTLCFLFYADNFGCKVGPLHWGESRVNCRRCVLARGNLRVLSPRRR